MFWITKKNDEVNFKEELEKGFKRIQEVSLNELNSLKQDLVKAKNEIHIKERTIQEQGEKLRDQNEADILFMCKKIERDILNGKKKEEIKEDLTEMARMRRMQDQMQTRGSIGLGSLGRGLGGGLGGGLI